MSTLDHLYKLRSMPEIEHKEFKTSAYIADRLEEVYLTAAFRVKPSVFELTWMRFPLTRAEK